MFESEVYLLMLPPLRRSNKQLASIIFFDAFWPNRMTFGFMSKHFVPTFSAVADGRLQSLPTNALAFQPRFVVSLILKFSASTVSAATSTIFPDIQLIFSPI